MTEHDLFLAVSRRGGTHGPTGEMVAFAFFPLAFFAWRGLVRRDAAAADDGE